MIHSIRFVPNNYSEKKVECVNKDPRYVQYPDLIKYNLFGLGVYITLSKEMQKIVAENIRNYKALRRN